MARSNRSRQSDQGPFPGEALGLPEQGPGSIVGMGRRVLALFVDWVLAAGLAGLAVPFGFAQTQHFLTSGVWQNTATVIWFVLGVVAVRLFQFTPGQFALGLRVASVDERLYVGLGRAAARMALIVFVVPALFVDGDGRGIQDRVTATAVVRR